MWLGFDSHTEAALTTGTSSPGRATIKARTLRTDRWWLPPLLTGLGLLAFVGYATFRAFQGENYYFHPYISPFYSPCLAVSCESEGAPTVPLVGEWYMLSPALLILIFPLGFRMTCYYYRKAYYRAFWLSPPACAVAEPHRKYSGETRFPLILQNSHRWWLYAASVFNVILTYDAILAFQDHEGNWGHMGLGTVVLVVNAVLLWVFTLSCNSCRSIVGGKLNHFSKHPIRYRMWTIVSRLNPKHMLYAWLSLFWVGFSDFYVALLASGTITDPQFF